jgi:putative inorganic carbon (HCO3(-)) transporter
MGKVNAPFLPTLQPSPLAGNRQAESARGTASLPLDDASAKLAEKTSLAYIFLASFVLIYWARPNYWVPGASGVPFAKISAALAIVSFVLWLFSGRRGALKIPREMVVLLLLYAQMCIAIPFAIWRGFSFTLVLQEYSKIVMVTFVAMMTITSFKHLRRLVYIQTATVLLMAVLALTGHGSVTESAIGGRLAGTFGGTYSNPNDFALDLAMIFPFAFAFLVSSRRVAWKIFWFVSMGLLIYTVLATFSRGGLLALLVAASASMWEFAVRGKRWHWVFVIVLGAIAIIGFSGPAGFGNRVSTIFHPDEDKTGSSSDRRVLLDRGIETTLQHPLVGIGPGNFPLVSAKEANDWHSTHNTYVQLSSEAGIPALILFLLMFAGAFSSLRRGRKLVPDDKNAQVLIGAVRASLLALAIGAFFADTAYQFFPYFLVAYAAALLQITRKINEREKELHPVPVGTYDLVQSKNGRRAFRIADTTP